MDARPQTIWTIGHSTHTLEAFVGILRAHNIQALVDVRLLPGSRRYPHFNQGSFSVSLQDCGIEYVHLPELGGRRKPRSDSRNTAWRNEAFRGYADHMETPEFCARSMRCRTSLATNALRSCAPRPCGGNVVAH